MAVTEALRKLILKNFETPGHPTAFSAPGNVAKFYGIKKEEAEDILTESDVYTLHREFKSPKVYNAYYVHRRRQLVQGDLIDISQFEKDNDGTKYLSLFIDVFTKKVWLYPLKTKTGQASAKVIDDWLKSLQRKPEILQTDNGTEYKNRFVRDVLRRHQVEWQAAIGTSKAAVAERANKSLQIIIYKFMSAYETTRYFPFLDNLVETYNSRPHRSLNSMTPNEADREQNQPEVHAIHTKRYQQLEERRKNILPFKIGDSVRIKIDAKKIDPARRAYAKQFKGEYFTIVEINRTLPIAMYYIQSQDTGERIQGGFYREELQKVKGGLFKIERVVAERGRGRNKQLLVKWLYFGDQHNSWINASNVERVFGDQRRIRT